MKFSQLLWFCWNYSRIENLRTITERMCQQCHVWGCFVRCCCFCACVNEQVERCVNEEMSDFFRSVTGWEMWICGLISRCSHIVSGCSYISVCSSYSVCTGYNNTPIRLAALSEVSVFVWRVKFGLYEYVTLWSIYFFKIWRNSPQRARASSFTRFLDHTQLRTTVGRTPLDDWSDCRRDLYLTTHNRQISMPPVGFEPTISAGERPQTALDRAATETGIMKHTDQKIKEYTVD